MYLELLFLHFRFTLQRTVFLDLLQILDVDLRHMPIPAGVSLKGHVLTVYRTWSRLAGYDNVCLEVDKISVILLDSGAQGVVGNKLGCSR